MANIKKITLPKGSSSVSYDIEALHFITGSLDTPAQWKAYIDSATGVGLKIIIDTKHATKEEPATTASAETMGKLYLVQLGGETAGGYTEFITIDHGPESLNPRYTWEKIGTTETDLTKYAKKVDAAKKGTYTSTTPSSNATSSAGGGTATGNATISYEKADDSTSSAGAQAITSGEGGAVSISYTPAGSITGSQTIAAHSHTVNAATASLTYVKSVNNASEAGSHSHDVDSHEHAAAVTAISGVEANGTTVAVTAISAPTGSITFGGTAATKQGVKVSTTAAGTGTVGLSGGSASGTFNTDAIKDITLASSTVSTSGPAYVASISGSAPSLGGTTSFVTDYPNFSGGALNPATAKTVVTGVTAAALTGDISFFKGATVSTDGVLSFTSGTVGISGGVASGTASIVPSYTLTKASLGTASTASVTISGGSYSATTKYMSHTVTAASTGSVAYTSPSLTGTKTFVTAAIASAELAEDESTSPAFAFNTDAIKAATSSSKFVTSVTASGTQTVLTGVKASGSVTAAGAVSAKTLTAKSAGAHTHTVTATTASITYVTGATLGTAGGVTVSGSNFGFSGTKTTLTQAAHTHSVSVASHTHAITTTSTSVTGTASVTVSAHTHDLGNHTHNTTIPAISEM